MSVSIQKRLDISNHSCNIVGRPTNIAIIYADFLGRKKQATDLKCSHSDDCGQLKGSSSCPISSILRTHGIRK